MNHITTWCVTGAVLVLRISSGEVLCILKVRIIWLTTTIGEEVRVLLTLAVESLTLMSVETTVIPSELGLVLHHTVVVKSSEFILLMVTPGISGIVTLILLECTICILRTRNVMTSDGIIMSTKLVITLSVKVEPLRVKEVTIR